MRIVLSDQFKKLIEKQIGFLQRLQVEIIAGASSDDVMKLCRRHSPDVVMLDSGCRGLSRAIARESALGIMAKKPFIVMAHSGASDSRDAAEPGVDIYLFEPFDIKEMLRVFSIAFAMPLRLDERIPLVLGLSNRMGDTNFPGSTIDISESGMRLATARGLKLGDTFFCLFRMGDFDEPVSVDCEVVWRKRPVESDAWQYGVRFINVAEKVKLRLREYVRCALETRTDGPDA